MEKEKMMKELEEKFNALKKELKIKSSLEDLDNVFLIKDYFLKEGFISDNLLLKVNWRISEMYNFWNGYLHSLILPNLQSLFSMSESKLFSKEEKDEIISVLNKSLAFISTITLQSVVRNRNEQARLIDDSLKFWNEHMKPSLAKVLKKANDYWKEESKNH